MHPWVLSPLFHILNNQSTFNSFIVQNFFFSFLRNQSESKPNFKLFENHFWHRTINNSFDLIYMNNYLIKNQFFCSLTPFCCTHHSWGEGNTIAIPLFWHFTWMHFSCWNFIFSTSSFSCSWKHTCSVNSWSHCFSLAPSKLTSMVMAIEWWTPVWI